MKFQGKVIKGRGRGKKMGFPTANLGCAKTDLAQAPQGVWAALAKLGKKDLPSIVFIGPAKTFGETEKRIEVYILDFRKNIYGRNLKISLLKKIRGNKKFKTEKELVVQTRKDEICSRELLKKSAR